MIPDQTFALGELEVRVSGDASNPQRLSTLEMRIFIILLFELFLTSMDILLNVSIGVGFRTTPDGKNFDKHPLLNEQTLETTTTTWF